LLTVFSGVRIGEERRNVRWEGSCWRRRSIFRIVILCQEYFCIFFSFTPRRFQLYATLSLYQRTPSLPRSPFFRNSLCTSPSRTTPLVAPSSPSETPGFKPYVSLFLQARRNLSRSALFGVNPRVGDRRISPCRKRSAFRSPPLVIFPLSSGAPGEPPVLTGGPTPGTHPAVFSRSYGTHDAPLTQPICPKDRRAAYACAPLVSPLHEESGNCYPLFVAINTKSDRGSVSRAPGPFRAEEYGRESRLPRRRN
jgi:hypothetical protein